jgi:hypothetical protein
MTKVALRKGSLESHRKLAIENLLLAIERAGTQLPMTNFQ